MEGGLLIDVLIFLGLLFILALILAPIYYFINKDKETDEEEQGEAVEEQEEESSEAD